MSTAMDGRNVTAKSPAASPAVGPLEANKIEGIIHYADQTSTVLSERVTLNALHIQVPPLVDGLDKKAQEVMIGFQIPPVAYRTVFGFTAKELLRLLEEHSKMSPYCKSGAQQIASEGEKPFDKLVDRGFLRVRANERSELVFFPTAEYFQAIKAIK